MGSTDAKQQFAHLNESQSVYVFIHSFGTFICFALEKSGPTSLDVKTPNSLQSVDHLICFRGTARENVVQCCDSMGSKEINILENKTKQQSYALKLPASQINIAIPLFTEGN